MEGYFSLGAHARDITTDCVEAETWFNRGLNWCYGFHHKEALRCFSKVIELDPKCPMGYWGIAYATGPYYNIPWLKMSADGRVKALQVTYNNARKAQSLATRGNFTPIEQALCNALVARFQAERVSEADMEATLGQWDDDYADEMREVYATFAQDNDVCALSAEALVCRTPWKLWDLQQRRPADGTDTLEAIEIIEKALQRIADNDETQHPGLLHFYVHIMEMSPEPEKALPASNALQSLAPDAGHLIHMPSHIYVLCGQYEKTIEANVQAVVADDKYIAMDSALGIYTIYRLHNFHFQVYGALFSGQYEPALRAANEMTATVQPEHLLGGHAFLVNYLEAFYGMKAHVYIRFGKWRDEPLPEDENIFCVTTAFWQYAKGVAYSVLGDIDNALKQQKLLRKAVANVPAERPVFQNESRDILAVAETMLAGELEYRRQNYDVAFTHLRRSVELYDDLNYSEPWSWMQPPRHALGALLLEQGHVGEAAQSYRADLGLDDTLVRPSQHPNNIWSLLGYAECCRLLEQTEELQSIEVELTKAQLVADAGINVSCFCRTAQACCDC